MIACVGCGAIVPESDDATHAYLGASSGCWELYSEIFDVWEAAADSGAVYIQIMKESAAHAFQTSAAHHEVIREWALSTTFR